MVGGDNKLTVFLDRFMELLDMLGDSLCGQIRILIGNGLINFLMGLDIDILGGCLGEGQIPDPQRKVVIMLQVGSIKNRLWDASRIRA